METNKINPDSIVLGQLDGRWQQMFALVLWKLLPPGAVVKITDADIAAMQQHFAPDGGTIFTHGLVDGFEFSLVDMEKARELAEFDRKQRGNSSGGVH